MLNKISNKHLDLSLCLLYVNMTKNPLGHKAQITMLLSSLT